MKMSLLVNIILRLGSLKEVEGSWKWFLLYPIFNLHRCNSACLKHATGFPISVRKIILYKFNEMHL